MKRPTEEKKQLARKRICLALDFSDPEFAIGLVEKLHPYIGLFKIGKQLHTSCVKHGIDMIEEIYKRGSEVFLDLKLHDTPNTVYQAAKECTRRGVSIFNIHVAGGKTMCQKAKQGAIERSKEFAIKRPAVIGVTVLTSLDDSDLKEQGIDTSYDSLVYNRTVLAKKWGLDGIVCPANKAGVLEHEFGKDFLYVTPGIKWKGNKNMGQKQLYTPDRAVQDCKSSILVIGSAITKSDTPKKIAQEILDVIASEI